MRIVVTCQIGLDKKQYLQQTAALPAVHDRHVLAAEPATERLTVNV